MKRAIYPLYALSDEGKVRPILDALKERGVTVQDAGASPGKEDALVLFLSEAFQADRSKSDAFIRLSADRALVIPVNLDGCAPTEDLQSALMARHALDGRRYAPAELAGRIAEALKGKSRLPLLLSLAAAVILLAVGGLILWRNKPAQETAAPVVEESPSPAPTATPTPAPHVDGIDLDLSLVAEVVYVGDTFQYYSMFDGYHMGNSDRREERSYHQIAYDVWDDGALRFYSTEDGREIPMAPLGDVSYLKLFPNLLYLTFVNVEGELPDLSSLWNLRGVTIINCHIPDIRGLAGCGTHWIEYHGATVKDFAPLNDCPNLNSATIAPWGSPAEVDLSDFHPEKLNWLNIAGEVTGLEGISSCARLSEFRLKDAPAAQDLGFLAGLPSLKVVELDSLPGLWTLHGLEDMGGLTDLRIHNCARLQDISALEGCSSLGNVDISGGWMDYLTDVSVLGKLPRLQNIGLYGVNTRDLNFLKELRIKKNINLGFAIRDNADYAGLAAVDTYSYLHVNTGGNYAAAAPYLEGKTVRQLMIYNGGLVDLSTLPIVTSELDLCHCLNRDLSGLVSLPSVSKLFVQDCPYFSSFNGIESLPGVGGTGSQLVVENCPRLADWSGIEGKTFFRVELKRLLTLPDLSGLSLTELALEQLGEDVLPDLTCLDGLDDSGFYNLRFVGMDQIQDLSPLFRLKGRRLEVPPQVGEQAQGLVEDGLFQEFEIVYPDGGWDPNDIEVKLLSLDELDTLPPSILKHVKRVTIIGDELVNDDTMNFWSDWSEQNVPAFIEDRETGEQKRIDRPGTLFTDFSKLSVLTGLEDLNLWWQPLTDLDGIQALENLQWLKVEFCPQLTDVSAAFTLQGLREINFERCPVASLQGVQNLYDLEMLEVCNTKIMSLEGIEGLKHLRQVRIAGTNIRDFSPLGAVDFSYAMEQEWMPGASLALNVMNSHQLPQDALAFLEDVPGFGCLELHDVPARLWVEKLAGKPILELRADHCGITQEQFDAIVAAHPELEEISVSWNQQITDVSALRGLENPRWVRLSHDMPEAIASLGEGYGFELQID